MKLTNVVFKPKFAPTFAPRLWFGPKAVAHMPFKRSKEEERMARTSRIRRGASMLGGLGAGAGLMFLLDPDRGRRRRAMARDEFTRTLHQTGTALDKGMRDLNNRVSGRVSELLSTFQKREITDDVLRERVRSALGRTVAHPHAVEVEVKDGHVTLSGHILSSDLGRLINRVRHMRGVRGVTDTLSVHAEPGSVPDLQGRPQPIRESTLQPRWTPAMRLGVAAGGSFLAVYGAARRGLLGLGFGAAGLTMVTRALKQPVHVGAWPAEIIQHGVHLQKTINIDAPLDRVFQMLSNPETFPRFMSHVDSVSKVADNVYRWTLTGPGGATAHWDAEITRYIDKELLEWKTRPGSMVQHCGVVRLDPTPYGGTRVQLRLSYRPPLGAVGEMLGEVFNLYPKHVLDQDLARFKSLLEQGKTTAHHERVRLEDVG
jgi:uncharacterized membrane protein/uncharacterized protein YwbE